jgi:FkbM family methyltransferase
MRFVRRTVRKTLEKLGVPLSQIEILPYIWRGLGGKLSALTHGKSAVSASCQVPDLRRKYLELGLLHSSGIFVEIGAFDGEQFSNTSFLADQGWRGLYVEPVPDFCRRIKHRHALNNVAVENVAISQTRGTCVLDLMGALSTSNTAMLQAHRSIAWAESAVHVEKKIEVKAETLEAVLAHHAIPANFDLMIVDVEGNEEPIIVSLLASRWRPRVLVVELCDIHPDFSHAIELQDSHRRVRQSLLASRYREFYTDYINSIFRLECDGNSSGRRTNN